MSGVAVVGLSVTFGVAWAHPMLAQQREHRRSGPGSPEGRLMLYYSSAIAFSPVGVPAGAAVASRSATASGIEAALEVSYLPPLSADQRTAGFDKPEATNLAPLFVRPRVAARLPGGFGAELSWIPPVRVFDVRANLFAGAVARAIPVSSRVTLVPRLAVLAGRVEGPITCNRETSSTSSVLATYYTFVCYGRDSRDRFDPRHLSAEMLATSGASWGHWQPYAVAGARAERTRFDIGVIRRDGSRDPDQPVLEVRTVRGYGAAGATWTGMVRTRLTMELYYAPGSTLTVRGAVGVRLR